MGELAASVLPGAAVVGGGTQYTKGLSANTVFMAKRRSTSVPCRGQRAMVLWAVQRWWELGSPTFPAQLVVVTPACHWAHWPGL